ncbi:MAG: PLD nuclease N-terminal domain-containing protein [Rothia sp. (in: high G+C Gram-positive bacteria)]|nr:PLD nuclease N-terminal domain-containing protein [Rothia sp. (in: high G+C Gram-positive bacteria)]
MARAILIIGTAAFLLGVIIYALIDCLRTEQDQVKALPKPLWALAIVLFPLAGALLWLIFGKHKPISSFGPVLTHPGPQAPDDDEDYLRYLEARSRRQAQSQKNQEKSPKDKEETEPPEDQGEADPKDQEKP